MIDKIAKTHTTAYTVMRKEADRLDTIVRIAMTAKGHAEADLHDSVTRGCSRAWDRFLMEAIDPGGPHRLKADEMRAALVRLKAGKGFLWFYNKQLKAA